MQWPPRIKARLMMASTLCGESLGILPFCILLCTLKCYLTATRHTCSLLLVGRHSRNNCTLAYVVSLTSLCCGMCPALHASYNTSHKWSSQEFPPCDENHTRVASVIFITTVSKMLFPQMPVVSFYICFLNLINCIEAEVQLHKRVRFNSVVSLDLVPSVM
jgi:hypothetical protein